MSSSTSSRTGGRPTLRRSSSFSRASSRFSASSSSTSTSSFRVTRNAWCWTTCMPLNSWSRCRAITSSKATYRPSASGMNRDSTVGTLTRANCRMPVSGLRTRTARLIDRPEMYGNGCDGSTASGVRTGKMRSAKSSSIRSRSSAVSWSQRRISMPSAASSGRISSVNTRACSATSSRVRLRIAECRSRGSIPLTPGTATPAAIRRFSPATRTM